MILSPCNTTPAQNKLSRHHHDMAWHHMTWKRHSARHGMTWHGITLLDINTWHDMTFDDMASLSPYDTTPAQNKLWHHHDMAWHDMESHCLISLPDMTYDDLTRQGKALQLWHFSHTLSSHSIWANMYHRSLRSLTTSRPWWRSQQTSNFQPEVAVTGHKPSFDIINQVLT